MKITSKITSTLTGLIPKSLRNKNDLSEAEVNYLLQDVKAKWFFYAIFAFLGIAMLYIFQPYLGAIFMGTLLAVLFHPIYRWLERKTHWPQKILTFLVVLMMILIILIPTIVIGGMLLQQVTIWLGDINSGEAQTSITNTINQLPIKIDTASVSSAVNQSSEAVAKWLLSLLTGFAKNIGELFAQTIVLLSVFIVLIPRIRKLARSFINASPLGKDITREYLQQTKLLMTGTVVGSACVSATSALIMGITFYLTGVPAPLLFSSMAFIIGFIPYMGTWIFSTIVSLVYVLSGDWQTAAIIMGVQLVIINQVDLIFRPISLPKKVRIHPALTTIAVLAGLAAFGIVGLFYGMIIMVLFISSVKIYKKNFVDSSDDQSAIDKNKSELKTKGS